MTRTISFRSLLSLGVSCLCAAQMALYAENKVPHANFKISSLRYGTTGSYVWDRCTFRSPSYTTEEEGAPQAPDNAQIMAALSSQFSKYGYQDFLVPANEYYVNDVPANYLSKTPFKSNSRHKFPPAWITGIPDSSGKSGTARPWPIPAESDGPTGEGALDGTTDGVMSIVEHTSPSCSLWESSGTNIGVDGASSGKLASLSAYSGGEYQSIAVARREEFYGDFGGWPGCPAAAHESTSAAVCEGGTGPTRLSNIVPSIKWEEISNSPRTVVRHTIELVLPPCSPAGQAQSAYPANESEGVISGCHDDEKSMRYGEKWLLSPTAPCMTAINAHQSSQDYAVAYSLIHYGAMLLNTTGKTKHPVLYAYNGIGVTYPSKSPYSTFPYLRACHFLTNGYILPHQPSL